MRVLAGYGQLEQGKSTYPGGDSALNVTTGIDQATRLYGTGRRPAFRLLRRTLQNVVQAAAGDRIYYTNSTRLWSVAAIGGAAKKELDDVAAAALAPDGVSVAVTRRSSEFGVRQVRRCGMEALPTSSV